MTISTFEANKALVVPLLKHSQFQEALDILEPLEVSDRSGRLELLEMLAICYFRLGLIEKAASCYQQWAEEDPQSAKPLINLGAAYNRLKQFDQAILTLRKAIQRDKTNVDAYYNLGFAQRHSGHPALAIPAYKEAIRLNPQLEQGHVNLANAYLETNNTALAITHFRQALALNPQLEAAQRGLQRALKQGDDNQQKNNNPFGRLVDMDQLAHQTSTSTLKVLSEAEREKDRQEVLRLTKGIRNAARHTSEELREKMQPALLSLTRALIDGENRPDLIAETHERFHQELPRFQESLRYLKRSILELRGHEELMNTPDINF